MAELQLAESLADLAQSKAGIVLVKFTWTIKNYMSYTKKEVGFELTSPEFFYQTESRLKTKWFIQACPNGEDKESENYLSLFLHSGIYNALGQKTAFYMSILNHSGEKIREEEGIHLFDKKDAGCGWKQFIKTTTLQRKAGLLPEDPLTICCTIKHDASREIKFKEVPECRLGDDLSNLFETGLFSDVILKAEGKEFKVHRSILATRSSVFAAMFQSEMKEKNQDIIEITEMDKDVLRDMLYFIYAGEAPEEKTLQLTIGLLIAADKYDLRRLKRICEKDLCRKLTIGNAPNLLITADLHNASELKATSMRFVNKEISAVMKTESWKWLVQSHHVQRDHEDIIVLNTAHDNKSQITK